MQTQTNQQVIQNEEQYRLAIRTLDQKRKPARFLRLVMNALEAYRQARKMGWSRPQNKKGLTVFQSYTLDAERDRTLINSVFAGAREEFAELGEREWTFLAELEADPKLMAFVFVHDLEEAGRRFEGITYSLGRRSRDKPRFRDRFDLILEAEIVDGQSQGLSRVRTYVDPFVQPIRHNPAWTTAHHTIVSGRSHALFERGSLLHEQWQADPERHWSHWTTEYIDYFGPRKQAVAGTRFATAIDRVAERQTA